MTYPFRAALSKTLGLGLLAVVLLSGCDPYGIDRGGSSVDLYGGFFDPSVLAGGFAPQTAKAFCPKGRCYPAQQGYLNGKSINFYNLFSYKSSDLAMDAMHPLPLSTLVGLDAYDFPNECMPGPAFNPQTDAYSRDAQFPIFAKLPLSATAYPFVARHTVAGLTGNVCNDLKTVDSLMPSPLLNIKPAFGAMPDKMASDIRMWTVIDPTAILTPLKDKSAPSVSFGWYNDLLISYFDSGVVPTDGNGNLVAMTGVIVNPAMGSFSKPTDPKVVILPFGPGDPGYSPIVALRNYALADTEKPGDYTSICGPGGGMGCADLTQAGTAFNTILIYANP